MSQFFPVDKLIVAALLVALLVALVIWVLHDCYIALMRISKHERPKVRWWAAATVAAIMLVLLLLLTGCGDTINPVRYQPVEVLVTKPCMAGRAAPAEAATLTRETCDANGNCVRTCTDTRPEVCVTHAVADITELQREARQYRNLFKECSK